MKLKVFSTEETNQLITDLNRFWELCGLITDAAYYRIEEAHNAYLRNFKRVWYKPFERPIKRFESMVVKLTGGQFRDVEHDFMERKGFSQYLSSFYFDADPDYKMVQPAYDDLLYLASQVGWMKHEEISFFHQLVEEYAEQPLVPEEKDVVTIQMLRGYLSLMEKGWKEYNDAI